MRHHFIDEYSDGGSFIHRLDPRAKLAGLIIFISFVISTPPGSFVCFALYGALICGLILISGIPPAFVIKRSLCIFPFVFLYFYDGLGDAQSVYTPFYNPLHTIHSLIRCARHDITEISLVDQVATTGQVEPQPQSFSVEDISIKRHHGP